MQKIKLSIKRFIDEQKDSRADWYLIGAIWLLIIFGLIMLASAGVAQGWNKHADVYYYIKHQLLVGFLPGTLAFIFFWFFDYKKLQKYAGTMLFLSIGLLVLVLIPGIGGGWGSADSWIHVFGFSFQPSEAVKLTFLIYLSSLWSQKEGHHIKDLSAGFMPFLAVLGVIAFLMMCQPDTGTLLVIVAISLSAYFAAGASILHLTWLGGLGVAGLWLAIKLAPYRAARWMIFLHPELDPKGKGYHIGQAVLAIGSGGWFGRGYGHSRQKFAYLPEASGDSIFAVTAEELGFFLTCAVIAAFTFVAIRGFKLAARCKDKFGRLLVVGIITWFVIQAFVNMCSMMGLMPMTGVTLPFVSYGGSSLLATMAAAGMLANISKQNS